MRDMDRLINNICDELDKIAEKGLNTANLETAYKLVDMYKDLKDAEYRCVKQEYYEREMGDGYSGRRSRDSRGRYTKANGYDDGESYAGSPKRYGRNYGRDGETYDRYMDSKQSYRANKSSDCKQRLMDCLEDYMEDFSRDMEEMLRDSDCAEERSTIKRYIEKIKNVI